MSSVTIRLNDEEKKIFSEYAKLHDIPLSTLLKIALKEKMEDELDLKLIEKYEKKVKNKKVEYFTHEEVCKMFVAE